MDDVASYIETDEDFVKVHWACTAKMNNDDCVTVEIELFDGKLFLQLDIESTLAQLRAHVEANYGALNVWSNSYSAMVDYTETMQEIRANAELAHDDDDGPYTGIVHFTAWYEAVIAGTEHTSIDVNDTNVLQLSDYIDIMHGTPAVAPHRRLRIVIENFTGYGDKVCAQSVDTGVSISYFYAMFPPNFPVQFHRHGRPLVAGPLKDRVDLDVGLDCVVQATGKVFGGMPKRDAAAAELTPVLNRRRAACSGGLGGGAWAEYILQILVYAYSYSMVAAAGAMEVPAALQALRSKCITCKYREGSHIFDVIAVDMTDCGVCLVVHDVTDKPGDYQNVLYVDLTEVDIVPEHADSGDPEPESGSGVVLSRRRAACSGAWEVWVLR